MAGLTKKINEFTNVLDKVDVSEIIISLAKGIADAQVELDNNSVRQAQALASEFINGKSLIELGFVPAFYAFEYVDVSASINLRMRYDENTDLDGKADLDTKRKEDFNKETLKRVEKEREKAYRSEFSSSNDVVIKSNSTKYVKIDDHSMRLNQSAGCLSKVEQFEAEARQRENIDRMFHQVIETEDVEAELSSSSGSLVHNSGFWMLSKPSAAAADWGILKIGDFKTATEVKLNSSGDPFEIGADAGATKENIRVAIDSADISGDYYDHENQFTYTVYFGFNKYRDIDENYTEGTYGNSSTTKEDLRKIALILHYDPAAKVEIIGHTDSSGPNSYNKDLSRRRMDTVISTLKCLGGQIMDDQILAPGIYEKGETEANEAGEQGKKNPEFRKVEIKLILEDDYVYFEGTGFEAGEAGASPKPTANDPNKFIHIEDNHDHDFVIEIDGVDNSLIGTSFSEMYGAISNENAFASLKDNFSYEARGRILYLLHHNARIQFTALSESSSQINIEEELEAGISEKAYREEIEVYSSLNRSQKLKEYTRNKEGSRTVAFGIQGDAHYERRFGIDITANTSVAARMISVPPPEGLMNMLTEGDT